MRIRYLIGAAALCGVLIAVCGCSNESGGAVGSPSSEQTAQPSPEPTGESPSTESGEAGLPDFLALPSGDVLCSAVIETDYNGGTATRWTVIFAPDQPLDSVYSFYDSVCSEGTWASADYTDVDGGLRDYRFYSWDGMSPAVVGDRENTYQALVHPPGVASQMSWEFLVYGSADDYSPEFVAALSPDGPVASAQGAVILIRATQFP